jgi:hypothetical protein
MGEWYFLLIVGQLKEIRGGFRLESCWELQGLQNDTLSYLIYVYICNF